ncbi:MAG: dihydropyrimidinase [Bacteroidia bacterium]|nr:dihydropyrimidinase [Bacteroidia bacterium]
MKSIVIRNGHIITAKKTIHSDLLISGDKIRQVSRSIKKPDCNTRVIDADSLYVFPGAVDAHVHFDLPTPARNSCDDFESGSMAAIAGGTTSFIDFVTPGKGESYISALRERKKRASGSLLDYGLHMGITWWGEKSLKEVEQCVKKEGITSFKTYMAYKGTIGIGDQELIKTMTAARKFNALVTAHCENGDLIKKLQTDFIAEGKTCPEYHALSRPPAAEAEAIFRTLSMAKITGCKIYIVHVSSKAGIEIIEEARKSGQKVFAETCPHYLLMDDSVYRKPLREAISYVLSPPLRKKSDIKKLWGCISDDIFDVIATDHCPFNNYGQKDRGIRNFTKIPNGGNGVEERLSLMFTNGVLKNKITLNQFVKYNSTNPAKIFGLYPQKGEIAVGSDADIVLWDPKAERKITAKTHHSQCDTNIYEGIKTKGAPAFVIARGRVVYENGTLNTDGVKGNYLFRK